LPSKRGNMFYAEPIDADSLRELLHYYVQSGVGLPVSEKGVPGQWTDVGLEAALAEIGINVDKRSIQSWLSGASVPKVEKLKGLASLASSDRFERERPWMSGGGSSRPAPLRQQTSPPACDGARPLPCLLPL